MGEVDKRAYHITFRREDSKWQVKLAGSDKPIKIFPTKEEWNVAHIALINCSGG